MRLRLRSRLFVGVLIYLLLLSLVGAIGFYAAQVSLDGMHSAVEHHVHEVSVVGELAANLNEVESMLLLHTISNVVPDDEQRYERQVYMLEARMDALLNDLRQTQERFHDQVDIDNIDAFRVAWDDFIRVQDEQFLPLSRTHRTDEVYRLTRADGPVGSALLHARNKVAVLQNSLPAESTERLQQAEHDFARNRDILLIVLSFAGVIGVALGLNQATRLAQAIEALSEGARRVARGSLGHRVQVETGDELQSLADSFNGMTASLADMTERQNEQLHALETENAERRRVELALRDSEARFRSVTDSVSHAIVSVDAAGRIRFWNRGAEAIFGYSEQEILGQRWAFLLPDRLRAEHHAGLLQPPGAEPASRTLELFGLRKDGTEVPLEVSVSEWSSGDERFATAALRDVTERRAVERIKNEFVSMVSHELRTPLNGILGMADLLVRGNVGPQEREYAEAAQRSGEALLAIIEDILDLSRIEAGRLDLELAPFDVREVVEDVAALLARQAQSKGLELVCQLDPGLPESLLGDARRLRQVLLNLVANAVKFTDVGEVVVRATCAPDGGDRQVLRFEVVDTGRGVAESARASLFQPFSQGDASTRRFGGTGLGLAISKRLSELMGGEIGVDSTPGRGSTFWFTARFGRQAGQAGALVVQDGLRDQRVLVVDDNLNSREMLEQQLRAWRMTVESVPDPGAALDRLGAAAADGSPFAVALVDGLAMARPLAAAAQATRLVLLTPLGRVEPSEELASAGVAATIEKPVRRVRLLETLEHVLSGPAGQALEVASLAAPVATSEPPAPGVGGRVLLVDDTPSSRQVAAGLLRGFGCSLDMAANGQEALEVLERQWARGATYAAVLMDCQMPVMDGFETTAEIRRREAGLRGHLPIIAMTANAMRGDREQCLAAGMDGYIAKPLRFEKLRAALSPFLEPAADPDGGVTDTAEHGEATLAPRDSGIDWPALTALSRELDRFAPPGARGEGLADMVAQFRVESYGRLTEMREAAQAHAPEALREAAHGLRGTASTLAARDVVELASQVEQIGRNGTTAGAEALIEALQAAVDRANAALADTARHAKPTLTLVLAERERQ
jgi:two-component system, sensor histidine kinase and response regulator